MKTNLPFIAKRQCPLMALLVPLLLLSYSGKSQTYPSLTFKNASLQSGTALQAGAVYKFPSVASGVDAFVTIHSLLNGATVTNIDQFGGVGYDNAFQPIVKSVAPSQDSYARFLIEFKTTGGAPYTFPSLAASGLDIDASGMDIREYCTIDMGGGMAKFMSTTPEISVAQFGTAFKATNIAGNNISGIDSSRKEVMFTVLKSNVSSMYINLGSIRTSGSGDRNYSVFFTNFEYPQGRALPVKLHSFHVFYQENKAALKWESEEEINASHYEIEKSTDGKNFQPIGLAMAIGNSNKRITYNFSEQLPPYVQGVIYYRLKMTDIGGNYSYSDTRMIRISQKDNTPAGLISYPNPAYSHVNITLPQEWQTKKIELELFSLSGNSLYKSRQPVAGQTIHLPVQFLAPGLYTIRITDGTQLLTSQIVKR